MSISTVRVGVRIRPFVVKEKGQNDIIEAHDKQSLIFKGQTFTYDHVFGSGVSQSELYSNTAGPMLKSFLEGYNCTIIAYGQTGSGKTFSMGTSDLQNHDSSTLGLVPRFVNDLFENLNHPDDQNAGTTFKIRASFLEIYGEDVYDLLAGARSQDRASLPVREDEHGKVFVQGQVEHDVCDAESALETLVVGSNNRITAATAMNVGSSRSHAVYTLTLEQRIKNNDGGEDNEGTHLLSSKLTFVDLAGSERIKRTGAEGQRMKEGIQINSGLFNLGQVINSLADEQRLLKNGNKASFVPYRNSKLTHLLKDALGGNSQTLFLACVSPAESNESETYSTLSYARQARNIQNKPVQNVDETQAELRRLKCGLRTWMLQAVKLMFATPSSTSPHMITNDSSIPGSASKSTVFSPQAATLLSTYKNHANVNEDEAQLLQRPEVLAFIESVNVSIKEKATFGASPSPRKVRLSVGAPAFRGLASPSRAAAAARGSPRALLNTGSKSANRMSIFRRVPPSELITDSSFFVEDDCGGDDERSFHHGGGGRESILFSADLSSALEAATKVDESEQLIEKMLDMVSQEKKLLAISSTSTHAIDDNTDTNRTNVNEEQEAEQLASVDKLIQEKEEILTKLLDNVKGYATLKAEFEKLVDAISGLENEKNLLEDELEKARKSNQSSTSLDKIKERFAVVKEELRRMKEDRKTKEQAYRLMQKESKQCDSMQKEVQKLKESRVALLKQQKSQAQELQRLKKEQTTKLQGIQRADIKKQQQMNAIKSELMKKERIIGHKEREVSRIHMKLKACEDHITQLLKIQQRQRQAGTATNSVKGSANPSANMPATSSKASSAAGNKVLDTVESEHLTTSKAVLEQAVLTQVDRHAMRYLYTKKTALLKELNHEMVAEAKELEAMLVNKAALRAQITANDDDSTELQCELTAIENDIELVELKLQQRTRVIDMLNADIDELSLQLDAIAGTAQAAGTSSAPEQGNEVWTQIGRDIITGLSLTQAHQLLLDLTNEKILLCQKLRTLDADLTTSQMQYNQAMDLAHVLDEQLQRTQELHRKQLAAVEKKRVEDIWSIMQATTQQPTAEQSEGSLQHDVAVKQANLLQKQLHEVQEQVESTRIDAEMQQVVITQQLNTIHDLKLRLQVSSSNSSSASSSEQQQVDEECMNKLRILWEEIGTSFEERESVLQFIMKSHVMAKERAIYDAETNLKTLEQEFQQKKTTFDAFSYALNNSSTSSIHYAKLGKVQAIEHLTGLIQSASEKVQLVLPKVVMLQEQLHHNKNEMWLTTSDLSPSLQAFEAVSACKNDIQAFTQTCCAHKVTIQAEQMEAWSDEIKALHLKRVQTTAALITIRDQCIALCDDLQLVNYTQPNDLQVLLETIFTQDEEVTPRGIIAVIQILAQQLSSNPPGSVMLLSTFEKVKLLLESVRLSRCNLSTNLVKLLTAVNTQLQQADPAFAQLEAVIGKEQLTSQLQAILNLPVMLKEEQENRIQETSHLLSLLNNIDLSTALNEVQVNITRNTHMMPHLASVATINDVHEELIGLEMFIEEPWLQTVLTDITKLLHASNTDSSCKQLLTQIHYLQTEQKRLEDIIDIQQELVKSDKALVKHIVDLEEFEMASKQDRVKALSGNSKMLIEEEKYRKNGKRKYEQITEKMLQLYNKLLTSTTATVATASTSHENTMLEVKIDLNMLSGQGQLLLRGGVSKEKVELIRLHTSAAASVVPMTSSLPPAAPPVPAAIALPPAMDSVSVDKGNTSSVQATATVGSNRRTSLEKNSANSSRSNIIKKDLPSSNPNKQLLIKTRSESNVMTAAIKPATKIAKVITKPLVPGQPSTVLMPLTVLAAAGDAPFTAPRNTSNRRLSFHPPTPPVVGDEVPGEHDAEEKSSGNEDSRRDSGESSHSGSSNDENVLLDCDNVFGELIR